MDESAKSVIDAASIATVLGTLSSVLPPLAALFSIVWSCLRIYETKTVQRFLKRNKN